GAIRAGSSERRSFTPGLYVGAVLNLGAGQDHWLQQAQGSGIAALAHFALKLKAYLHGILSRCRHRLNTSIVEGINNTIKVIKRRAYGYRDQEYFFLKIRSAFPGIPR
ncbi:ISL3 family transposase, partial [Bordetella holmesii]|uniref:ISL3 family transposase n=1 Tax=Bordetella holmesii TaxID=35814 RepID=UPI000459CDE1